MHIQGGEQALEFVRLFSRDGHWRLSGVDDYAEPVPGPSSDPTNFVVQSRDFARCCTAAAVREYKGGSGKTEFEITRTLVDREYRVYRVTEVVGEDGDWQLVRQEKLAADGRTLGEFLLLNH